MSRFSKSELEIYWPPFLQMLSVKMLEPYLEELGLPFTKEQFPGVMRLARACLEVEMFCTGYLTSTNPERALFIDAWHTYHQTEGVLDEENLREHCPSKSRPGLTRTVFIKLQDRIGEDTSTALIVWFNDNYPKYLDDTWRWPWAIKKLFNQDSSPVSLDALAGFTHADVREVLRFSAVYEELYEALVRRIYSTRVAAEASTPTPWERVLQTFPIDNNESNERPWFGTIETCLQLRLLRREWTLLHKTLGSSKMKLLFVWVRENKELLPNNRTLPEPPKLLG
jgi:hypothetical protein